MTSAQREFLVQRLMEDSQKMRKSTTPVRHKPRANSSDSDEHSDSSSDQGCGVAVRNGLDSENATVPSLLTVGTNGGHVLDAVAGRLGGMSAPSASSLFTGSPLQYAATLVSLAQMNFLPPAAASTLPLLYPHLYQSLLTMPNFDRLRFQQQQQSPTELLSRLAGKTPEKFQIDNSCGVVTTSLSTTTTPVVTPKLGANHATPSPRKRSSQTAKNVDPKKSSDPFADYGNGGVDTPKKPRAIRKIQFDDEKSSPVSGMYIKDASDVAVDECASNGNELLNGNAGGVGHQQEMLLHESADFVQITEEAKKQLAKITNVIGDYVCQLCKLKYDDAFRLAMHKCPRIGHKIYRCPECDKVFSCPANLASHRRWHRPKDDAGSLGKSPAKCQASENNGVVAKLQHQFQRKNISSFIPPLDSPVSFVTDDDPVADGPVDLTSKSAPATSTVVEADDVIDSGDQQVDISVFSENGALTYFQCEFCKKKFDCHRLLRSHAISHTSFADCGVDGDDANDPETRCDQCDLWFLSRDCYEKHARRSHPKFLCKFCRESFPTSPALTRHINKRHPNAECKSTAFAQDYICTSDHVVSTLSK